MAFTWDDGERTIHFGRGVAAEAVDALGGPGYTLLTTERASSAAPWIAMAAGAVHLVPAGHVDHIAADLRGTVKGDRLVALGGGRVIDVTKALAAADGGRAMAIPTTLSGAEMTQGHRHARGVDESTPRVRPAVVVFDPALAASQPVAGARRELAQRARPRGRGRRARCARTRSRRSPPTRPRGCWRRAGRGARARPRHARARRAAGRLRDRLDRPRAAPRARPDARAPRRDRPRPRQRGDAAAHDRRAGLALPGPDRGVRRSGRARRLASAPAASPTSASTAPCCRSAPTRRRRAPSSRTRRPPPTAPRSSRCTRVRSKREFGLLGFSSARTGR